ncbi:hypothetical protein [Pontibacillus yanchengensis]|uniref:Uncharacterized protein n=1 Tax=Pontibacillus yanchengensis Y32 TaxID=1385514 RepID=A0A0A2TAQ4_9BACI|nr:hypothetical protein [Pontibacillus yanchengensis]KGP72862.1 hypothetical protein N782_10285 [Pontibacillus yanchengensis Y32]
MMDGKLSRQIINLLDESELNIFLIKMQSYLYETSTSPKSYEKISFTDIPHIDQKFHQLTRKERRLLRVKIHSFILRLDEVKKVPFPSPFVNGVIASILLLLLGGVMKNPTLYPVWMITLIATCFVIVIPAVSWMNLHYSGKDVEKKEILTVLASLLEETN